MAPERKVDVMKNIILLVGSSGTGKTTIQRELAKEFGLKALESYTSRAPRYEGEEGHTFVTREEILAFPDIVAFTDYNGNLYCATESQVEESDVYVIDVDGVKEFQRLYHGKKTPVVVGLFVSEQICYERMIKRGDSEEAAKARIENDKRAFADMSEFCDVLVDTSSVSPKLLAEIIMGIAA